MVLVLDPNVEQDVAETVEHGRKPCRHGIGVYRNGDPRAFQRRVATHFSERLGLEQRCLRGQPQQRDTCGRRPTWLFPDHQHLADLLLQRLDALTDSRGGDM